MNREPLTNLQAIEYLRRIKEDTTIEEHRMVLDGAIQRFEKCPDCVRTISKRN